MFSIVSDGQKVELTYSQETKRVGKMEPRKSQA
jgi:hypothetical protein